MRERIALRELPFVLASFRKADAGLSGLIERDRFRSLLKRLDFGVSNVDDKVRLVEDWRGLGELYYLANVLLGEDWRGVGGPHGKRIRGTPMVRMMDSKSGW